MKVETEHAIRVWISTAEGWTTIDKALEMAQLIIDTKPETVVEIGTFAGGSAIPQALALKELGAGKLYAMDPWSRQAAVEQVFTDGKISTEAEEAAAQWWAAVDLDRMHLLCMQGIWSHGLDQYAIVIRARSEDCFQLFTEIDIIYIDGSHSEEASCRDVQLYVGKVTAGGFVWVDDTQWPTVQKALRMIEASCDLEREHETYRLYRKR